MKKPYISDIVLLILLILVVFSQDIFMAFCSISAIMIIDGVKLYKFWVRKEINLQNPIKWYGLFFSLYYCLPWLFLFIDHSYSKFGISDLVMMRISILISTAYISLGLFSKTKNSIDGRAKNIGGVLSLTQYKALFAISTLALISILYTYYWRNKYGFFFNQAAYYEQELTVAASIRDVLIFNLQLPLILWMGILATSPHREVYKWGRFNFFVFSTIIISLMILSSQTRPAISAYFFAILFFVEFKKIRNSILIGGTLFLVAIIIVISIQGSRGNRARDFAQAENQITYSLTNIFSNTKKYLKEPTKDKFDRLRDRSAGSIRFLAKLVDRTWDDSNYLYGQTILQGFKSLIPRVIWPEKPVMIPPDIYVQKKYNFPSFDATLGPLIQFYIEGGVLGVILGFSLLGLGLQLMGRHLFHDNKMILFMVTIIFANLVNLENELVIGSLVFARNGLVVFVLYKIVEQVFLMQKVPKKRKKTRVTISSY